jgi:hypothetical protein
MQPSIGVRSLVAAIEDFCAQPSPVEGEQLAADLRELARGRNLIDLKFSETAAPLLARSTTTPRDAYHPFNGFV